MGRPVLDDDALFLAGGVWQGGRESVVTATLLQMSPHTVAGPVRGHMWSSGCRSDSETAGAWCVVSFWAGAGMRRRQSWGGGAGRAGRQTLYLVFPETN